MLNQSRIETIKAALPFLVPMVRKWRRISFYFRVSRKLKKRALVDSASYLNSILQHKSVIQKLIIDSNDCITDMCLLGITFPTDKSPLNLYNNFRHAYTPIYNLLFATLKNKQINIAEIGISHGYSLQVLRAFFSKANIYGFDFKQKSINEVSNLNLSNTKVAFIDVRNEKCIKSAFENSKAYYDIIIDDSTHKIEHQINIIKSCMPFLNSGGILVIEDIFDDFRSPDSVFEEAIKDLKTQFSFASFIYSKNKKIIVGASNNEKLLVLIKN